MLGLGTWLMEHDERADCIAAIRRSIDLGMTHIDTAELYGDGDVEEMIAEAISGRRDEVFLTSKVLPQHANRRGTVLACETSLLRLDTDYLDLYLLHWREGWPLEETFAGMEDLVAAGKIRAYGVSNFDVDDLEAALAIVGPGKIACNQVLYHLGDRTIEHGVLPWCERNGVGLVAYGPLGSGNFPPSDSPGGRVLGEIAAAYDATPRQVALAFLVRRDSVFAIPKSSQVAHVEELAGAGDLLLDDEAMARLDAAFPLGSWKGLPVI